LFFSGCPLLSVLSLYLTMSWEPFPSSPVLAGLFFLLCSAYPVLPFSFRMPCSFFPVLAALYMLSCPRRFILESCPGSFALAVLS
jgi:hypothetical protein